MFNFQHGQKFPFILFAFLLTAIHFIFLMVHFEPAISTPDAHGYFTQAKLIAKHGKTYLEPESIVQYIGPHWHHVGDNHYYTTFPPGLPTILGVVYKIFGPKAALLVNPLMASMVLLGLFLLCRLLIGEGWGLLAAALMSVNPFANEHALFGDSHTAVTFFLIWGLYFLFQWTKTKSFWWILGAGFFVGIIPTVRYPELLFCLAFAIFALFHLRHDKKFQRSLIAGLVGAAIPICILFIRNQIAFGAFWRTGYSLSREQTAFSFYHFVNNALPYLQKIMSEGCALVFGFGIIGIAVMCILKKTRKQGILFALIVVPITLLYVSYYWKPDPQSMRFLLPTFFIYTIAGLWFLYQLTKHHPPSAWAGAVVLFFITVFWGLPQSLRSMQNLKQQNAVLAHVTRAIDKNIEPGNVLITYEGISQHLDFIGKWRLVDALQKRYRNIGAQQKYENLPEQEIFDVFSHDVWQWAGNRWRIFWVAYEQEIDSLRKQLPPDDKLVLIERIKIPVKRLKGMIMPNTFRLPTHPSEELITPQGPMGPNHIFDFRLDGGSLLLVEWTREDINLLYY